MSCRFLFLFCVLSLVSLVGCVAYENQHFEIDSTGTAQRQIRLGGKVTDQIFAIWDSSHKNSADTLLALRQVTRSAPIFIVDEGNFANDPWTTAEIWDSAISFSQLPSFAQAIREISRNQPGRTLTLTVDYAVPSTPVLDWGWTNRTFEGHRLEHQDVLNESMSPIVVRADGEKLILKRSGETFVPWGVNYDHDGQGRLLDEYWLTEWSTVEKDFDEMCDLGINSVRIHLQYGKFMDSPTQANAAAINQLKKLVTLAENKGIYLDITGLACYHLANVPAWYNNEMNESVHWDHQSIFWEKIAQACAGSPAVFCYDFMNEPVVGTAPQGSAIPWLVDNPLGNKYFVQRITIDLAGRDQKVVAKQWIDKMAAAIRLHDPDTLITLGTIPWEITFYPGGNDTFNDPVVTENLDFLCIHLHPNSPTNDPLQFEKIVKGIGKYSRLGKPVVIEEVSGYRCGNGFLEDVMRGMLPEADGWMGYYWGVTQEEYQSQGTIFGALLAQFLQLWKDLGEEFQKAAR